MNREGLSTQRLTEIWEDRREIKNLMGKLANCIILNREQDVFGMFWSREPDVCLGLNDGWYKGPAAVQGYYRAIYEGNALKARLIQKRFPEQLGGKSPEEIYGIGPFKVKPIGSQLIEVAGDGWTAKGIWHCQGAYAEIEPWGPASYWTWGYYCVDFIRENEAWKIWHMQYLEDINSPCGQSWGKPVERYPELPEFEELKGFSLPQPNVPAVLRQRYGPDKPHVNAPRLPEPYFTFDDTFSYGIEEG